MKDEVFVYKCPSCGGKVDYIDNKWHCSYCNNTYNSLFAANNEIELLYSLNYYTSDLDIDDYSTLIPVYIVKATNGLIYNIPGIKLKKSLNKNKKKKMIYAGITLLAILFVLIMVKHLSNEDVGGSTAVAFFFILAVAIPLFIVILYLYKKRSFELYDNFEYTKYSFGDKRKKIK